MKSAHFKRILVLIAVSLTAVIPLTAFATVIERFDVAPNTTDWTLSGNAAWDSDYQALFLTADAADQTGSIFWSTPLTTAEFNIEFDLWIGYGSGADGMAFAWVRGPGLLGGGGGSMGFDGLDGYGIRFDTYTGGAPEPENYVAISQVTPSARTDLITNDTIPEMEDSATGGGDPAPFHVKIEFDNGHLQMWMSNPTSATVMPETLVFDYTIAGFTAFDGYFGFTAATGGATNVHAVDNIVLNRGATAGDDQVVYSEDPVTLDGSASFGATSYTWTQIAGSPTVVLDNANPPDGIAHFTAPTLTVGTILTFQLEIQSADGPSSDTVTVTILAKNAPGTPTNLQALRKDQGLSLSWDFLLDADEYVLQIEVAPGVWWPLATLSTNSHTLSSLTVGQLYKLRVIARNTYGDSPPSEVLSYVVMANAALAAGTTPPSGYVYAVSHYDPADMNDADVNDTNDSWDGTSKADDYWGYLWPGDIYIDQITYYTGNMFFDGGWFTDLRVQYTQDGTTWINVPTVIVPDYDFTNQQAGKQPFTRYDMFIPTLHAIGVRVAGTPGGTATFTSIAELEVYGDQTTPRPLVIQGIDGEVAERGTGTIDASFSFSTRGDITSMIFSQVSGPAVTIEVTGDPMIADFEAPSVDADTDLVFQITGSDGTDTLSDEVTITVRNLVTTAVAGPDQVVQEGTTATLNGSGSLTSTGTLTYQWTQLSGITVTLNNANAAIADFEAPILWAYREKLTFQLEVNDGAGPVSTDEVVVKVRNFLTPADFEVEPIDPADWQFFGTASFDDTEGILVLTTNVNDQVGSAWMNDPIDCTEFLAKFKIYIGDGDGADGMAFGWVRTPGLGGGGGGMGFLGANLRGYGVKFDTYSGGAPEPENYIAAVDATHAYNSNGFFSNDTIPEMEDVGWFDVMIDMDNGHLQMWMGNESLGYPLTLVLDGTIPGYTGFPAYFGFGGATGGLNNNHWADENIGVFLPTDLPLAYAVRSLPGSYQAGGPLTVDLSVRADSENLSGSVSVTEAIPAGTTVADAGGGQIIGGNISWTLTDVSVSTITYTLNVNAGTAGAMNFAGNVNYTGVPTQGIYGDSIVYEIPAAPANVSVEMLIGGHVSWSASPQEGVVGYRVYSSVNGQPFTEIAFVTGSSFVDSFVVPGSTYNYKVSAVNAEGVEGPLSPATGEKMIVMEIREAEDFNYGGGQYPGYTLCPAAVEASATDDLAAGNDFFFAVDVPVGDYRRDYRPNDNCGIETVLDDGTTDVWHTNIGWTTVGDWWRYTFDVTEAGWIKLSFRVAAPSNATIAAYWDEQLVGSVTFNTGSWHTLTDAVIEEQIQTTVGPHTLRLLSTVSGFNFDKVGLGTGWGPPKRGVIWSDDFEDYTNLYGYTDLTTAGYTVVNGGGYPDGAWRLWNTAGDDLSNQSADIGGVTDNYVIADSDLAPEAAMNEELITPPIDCTDYVKVRLDFIKNYRAYLDDTVNAQVAEVDIRSSDDGITWGSWVNLYHYDTSTVPAADPAEDVGPEQMVISQYADGKWIQVRFHFFQAQYDYWFAVDDIVVTGELAEQPAPPLPIIAPDGSLSWDPFGGGNYTVQYTDDLPGGVWNSVPGTAWPITATAWPGEGISGLSERYYRVLSE